MPRKKSENLDGENLPIKKSSRRKKSEPLVNVLNVSPVEVSDIKQEFKEAHQEEEKRNQRKINLTLKKCFNFSFWTLAIPNLVILSCLFLYFYWQNQESYVRCVETGSGEVQRGETNLKTAEAKYAFDRTRMIDGANILLAINDYRFDKGSLPATLKELKSKNYLGGNLIDPEFGREYYYKRTSDGHYSACFYLSSGVWGRGLTNCPSKEDYVSAGEKVVAPKKESIYPTIGRVITITETPTGYLNIRSDKSTLAELIAKAYPNEQYKSLEEDESWIKIELKSPISVNGEMVSSGWVYKQYTK